MYPYEEMCKPMPDSVKEFDRLLLRARSEYARSLNKPHVEVVNDTTQTKAIMAWIERLERAKDQLLILQTIKESIGANEKTGNSVGEMKKSNQLSGCLVVVTAIIGVGSMVIGGWSSWNAMATVELQRVEQRPYIVLDPSEDMTTFIKTSTTTGELAIRIVNLGKLPGKFRFPIDKMKIEPFDLTSAKFSEKSVSEGVLVPNQWRVLRIGIEGLKEKGSYNKELLDSSSLLIEYGQASENEADFSYSTTLHTRSFYDRSTNSYDILWFTADID